MSERAPEWCTVLGSKEVCLPLGAEEFQMVRWGLGEGPDRRTEMGDVVRRPQEEEEEEGGRGLVVFVRYSHLQ